jgi:hypothetical protein
MVQAAVANFARLLALHGAPLRPSSSANYRPVGQIEQGAFFRGDDSPVAAFTDPVSVFVGGEPLSHL